MEFDNGEDGEYNGVEHVEVFKIFAMQDAYFSGTVSFDRGYDVVDDDLRQNSKRNIVF